MCIDTNWLLEYRSFTVCTGVTPAAAMSSAGQYGSSADTVMSKPLAMRATLRPTWPNAWMPMVLPRSSEPDVPSYMLRMAITVMPNTSSATAFEFCPGVFCTTTPCAFAVARSTLSYPAPARTTIFRFGAAASTSASMMSLRMITASASATAFLRSSAPAYFSSITGSKPAVAITSLMESTAALANGFCVAINTFMILSSVFLFVNVWPQNLSLPLQARVRCLLAWRCTGRRGNRLQNGVPLCRRFHVRQRNR